MAYLTKDQIAAARELDLLTYLQRYMPEELVKTGNGTYSTRTHSSLKISNGKWYWWSQRIGGVSALDYLVKVLGVPFPEAVRHIYECAGRTLSTYTQKRQPAQRNAASYRTGAGAYPRSVPGAFPRDAPPRTGASAPPRTAPDSFPRDAPPRTGAGAPQRTAPGSFPRDASPQAGASASPPFHRTARTYQRAAADFPQTAPDAYPQTDSFAFSDTPPDEGFPQKREFFLPEAAYNNRRVYAYLSSRGIDGELINFCFEHRMLYEDAAYHNAIFVGYDGKVPRYAFARSTLSKSTFMRELAGSDKHFSFRMPARDQQSDTVYVFESAIDALSFASILKHKGMDWRTGHYLSLGGAAMQQGKLPPALENFLSTHPQTWKLALCLDNDPTGRQSSEAIISAEPHLRSIYMPPETGKDYNEMLCAMKGITPRAKMRGHKEEVR